MGCARYFREWHRPVRIVAVDSVGSVTFGGASAPRMIPGLGTSIRPPLLDKSYVDEVVHVAEADTVRTCHRLARSGFLFGGPRIDVLRATNAFRQLPNVTNRWQRATVDVQYFFSRSLGIAAGYWWEEFDVSDYAAIDLPGQPGVPRIDYLGEIYTGYGNRPYDGNTAFVRMLYRF